MEKINIVYLDAYPLEGIDLSPLAELGEFTDYDNTLAQDVIYRAKNADVIIVNKVLITKEIMDVLPNLKLVCVSATGVNNVDVEYAERKGIAVRNVPAYSTESVAEATLAYVLALLRNILYYDRYVKDGSYSRSGLTFHTARNISEINGKKWGIIGLGNIGRRVAEIAKVFGAEVSYHSTSGKNTKAEYPHKTLELLLEESDIITIHAPLNKDTKGLIGAPELNVMKKTAVIVNMGRGGIVVEDALAEALDQDRIAGAGLDVFENEPLSADNPLLNVKNRDKLIIAPHSGWASREARELLVEKVADNIKKFYGIM
ncbi:MAG: D-2-hydroxyacid dehydrogenase [Rikenellaceae bacterium]|nr:D-2-hydroxyacid dehydrogenase [Rikenellaceae bacterium]